MYYLGRSLGRFRFEDVQKRVRASTKPIDVLIPFTDELHLAPSFSKLSSRRLTQVLFGNVPSSQFGQVDSLVESMSSLHAKHQESAQDQLLRFMEFFPRGKIGPHSTRP